MVSVASLRMPQVMVCMCTIIVCREDLEAAEGQDGAYFAVGIRDKHGHLLGMLCADTLGASDKYAELTEADKTVLRQLAAAVEAAVAAEQTSLEAMVSQVSAGGCLNWPRAATGWGCHILLVACASNV